MHPIILSSTYVIIDWRWGGGSVVPDSRSKESIYNRNMMSYLSQQKSHEEPRKATPHLCVVAPCVYLGTGRRYDRSQPVPSEEADPSPHLEGSPLPHGESGPPPSLC